MGARSIPNQINFIERLFPGQGSAPQACEEGKTGLDNLRTPTNNPPLPDSNLAQESLAPGKRSAFVLPDLKEGEISKSPADYQPRLRYLPGGQDYVAQTSFKFAGSPATVSGFQEAFKIHNINIPNPELNITGVRDRPDQLEFAFKVNINLVNKDSASTDWVLRGGTGSGKTYTFGQAIAPMVAEGRKVFLLVPTLSLATQFTRDLTNIFVNGEELVGSITGDITGTKLRRSILSEKQILVMTADAFESCRKSGLIPIESLANQVVAFDECQFLRKAREAKTDKQKEGEVLEPTDDSSVGNGTRHVYARVLKDLNTLGNIKPRIIAMSAQPTENTEGLKEMMKDISRTCQVHQLDYPPKRQDEEIRLLKPDERTARALGHLEQGALAIYKSINFTIQGCITEIEKRLSRPYIAGDSKDREDLAKQHSKLESLSKHIFRLCHPGDTFTPPLYPQIRELDESLKALSMDREFVERHLNHLRKQLYAAQQDQVAGNDAALISEEIKLLSSFKKLSPRALVGSLLAGLGEYGYVHRLTSAEGHLPAIIHVGERMAMLRLGAYDPKQEEDAKKLYFQRIYQWPSIKDGTSPDATPRTDHMRHFFLTLADGTPYEWLARTVAMNGHEYAPRWEHVAERAIPDSDPEKTEIIDMARTAQYPHEKYEWYKKVKDKVFEQGLRHFVESTSCGGRKEEFFFETIQKFIAERPQSTVVTVFNNATSAKFFTDRLNHLLEASGATASLIDFGESEKGKFKAVAIVGSSHNPKHVRQHAINTLLEGNGVADQSTSAGELGLHASTIELVLLYGHTSSPSILAQRRGRGEEGSKVVSVAYAGRAEERTIKRGLERRVAMEIDYLRLAV